MMTSSHSDYLLLDRRIVMALVDDFTATGKLACSDYQPDALRVVLAALPVVHCDPYSGDEFVDYHAVGRALEPFECFKLTAHCNSWTRWMRARIKPYRCRALRDPRE